LLGHNGAGKSTAIGMMLGQVWPSQGHARIFGHDVMTHRRKALEKVGAIFESPAFYDYLSGWRNLEILSSYTSSPSARRINEVVAWVGLAGREHGKVRTYSHGMRARLALAQALLPNPELLILDEPSDGLDPEGIHEMRQTIIRLHRELNLTILLSSHLLNEVEQLCTRIVVLKSGRKVFEGSLQDTRRAESWVRIQVNDAKAVGDGLVAAGLIKGQREGGMICLATGASNEKVSRWIIEHGFELREITIVEDTLENFYLRTMREQEGRP
jgi:ABC-2 type transport system ATP-binding protein